MQSSRVVKLAVAIETLHGLRGLYGCGRRQKTAEMCSSAGAQSGRDPCCITSQHLGLAGALVVMICRVNDR